jgi:hypothetical protein
MGIGFLSGVAGWLAGPVIARRIITQHPRVARAIARGTIAGGLSWVFVLPRCVQRLIFQLVRLPCQ